MSTYDERVRAYEAEGMARSDAQGIVDLEDMRRERPGDTMSTHTPGPWGMPDSGKGLISKKSPHGWDGMIATVDCGDYARSRAEGLANAAFIVRACNSHEAMLEALKAMLDTYAYNHEKTAQSEGEHMLIACVREARKAIRLAEWGQP